MVDEQVPTNQFHPYEPVEAVPYTEKPPVTGLKAILNRIGINDEMINGVTGSLNNTSVKQGVGKARDYARANPSKVLGGVAALIIGAGLMGMRKKNVRNRHA